MVEEFGELNRRIKLPPYTKTHLVLDVGRLIRYVASDVIIYHHKSIALDRDDETRLLTWGRRQRRTTPLQRRAHAY